MKGKLTIFVGYAAGVGKTYTMLKEAKHEMSEGVDVVVGYYEPHDRIDTLRELKGLEVLPYKEVSYNNITLKEFDLESAIKRKPQLILVDELAHTNPSSFSNSKRYMDILELLENGIDVYTTVNIQHIESLNSIIYENTKVDVKETIPDSIFDNADYIKVIDIDVDGLIERLMEGKVYNKAKVQNALYNFFKKENLSVLRELTLRKSADKLSSSASKSVKEIVLVCLSTSPSNPKVLRSAKNISDAFHGELYSVYVDVGQDDNKEIILKHQNIATNLGAKNKTVYGDNIYDEIVKYAKEIKATKIVIGKSVIRGVKRLYRKDIIDELNLRLPSTDIFVIPNLVNVSKKKKKEITKKDYINVLIAVVTLTITTLISHLFYMMNLNDTSILLLYLFAIVLFSMTQIRFIGTIIYTFISIMTFNFFFTEPRYTFAIYDKSYPIMLVIVFTISLLMNYVNHKLHENYKKTNIAYNRLKYLLDASTLLNKQIEYDDTINTFLTLVKDTLNCEVAFYKYDDKLSLYKATQTLDFTRNHELALASVCYQKKIQTGKYTSNLSSSNYTYYPVLNSLVEIKGVVGIIHNDKKMFSNFENALFISYIQLLSQQISLYETYEEIKKSQIDIENEKFKSTLLRSISHDLKTPLTGIIGNSQLLLKEDLSSDVLDKVNDIYNESNWLKNMINNILSITKVNISKNSEKKDLKLEVNLVSDIINESILHASRLLDKRNFSFTTSSEMSLINCESYLLVQAFVNIINNAVEHTKENDIININVTSNDDYITISFSNNGDIIKEEDESKLFELFYSTKDKDSKRGSGLGLYITKAIIEMHKGKIIYKKGENNMTIFEVKLNRYKGSDYNA